jgi:energy-coupling factor transporter ATP-binding protein EcfA2
MSDNKRNLPNWLDAFMLLTEDSEPPILFRKWTGISAIASALQRKCRVDIGISLTFYPNFYIVLVGPSATGKGTAMKYAYDIIEQIPAIRLSAQATSLQALIRRMKETNLTDIDIETAQQYFHSSLSIFSNEFTVFLGYHNRELITSLCDWYDCHNRWTYDTIKRDKEEVIGVWVNILAGTTPDNIQSSLPIEAIGGGLTSRIIFVFEEKKNKLVVFPSSTNREIELQQHLVHDLEQISMLSGRFQFTEDASGYYSEWCYIADANPPFHDPKFDGYCGRRRNHLLSLAMVCSASRGNDLVMTKNDIEQASMLLNEVEVKMGLVFRGIGKSDLSSLINGAIVFIENSVTDEIPVWQFSRYFEGDIDKLMMDRVLMTLEASNYIKLVRKPGMDQVIKILDRNKNDRSKIEQTNGPDS